MNFLCFSLVGFFYVCAPLGVSSTLEINNYNEIYSEGGFFQLFDRDAKKALENLKAAAIMFQNVAKSLGLDVPPRAKEISVFDSLPKSDETGSFFQEHGLDLREVVSLSNQLIQLASLTQQAVNPSSVES